MSNTTKMRRMKNKIKKFIVLFTAFNLLGQIILPVVAHALTSGPSQPEVESFTPIGNTDMVDLFSGDFSYNIPLLDIDGYPINIGYHSGITMDQEASWVGLGWNINPGAITRNMRGLPDDFKGDVVTKEFNMKPNISFGGTKKRGEEAFGKKIPLNISKSLGINYNNYNGISVEHSFNIAINSGTGAKGPFEGDLGINSSSSDGLAVQPSIGFQFKQGKSNNDEHDLGIKIGCSYNSRGGLKSVTMTPTAKFSNKTEETAKDHSNFSLAPSATFDAGQSTYTPSITFPMKTFAFSGAFQYGVATTALALYNSVGGHFSIEHLAKHSIESAAYGYMNSDAGVGDVRSLLDFNREKDGVFNQNTPDLPVTNFTYDIFSVAGQGIGGSYRAFRNDIGHVFDAEVKTTSISGDASVDISVGNISHLGIDIGMTDVNSKTGDWTEGDLNDATENVSFRQDQPYPLYEKYSLREANEKSIDPDPTFNNTIMTNQAAMFDIKDYGKFHKSLSSWLQLYKAQPASQVTSANNYRQARLKRNDIITVLSKDEAKDMGVAPVANIYNAPGHHIGEIIAMGTEGKRYVYGLPAYNLRQEETTFAMGSDKYDNGGVQYPANYGKGLVTYNPDIDNTDDHNTNGLDNYYNNTIMPPYAHSFLLTSILSSDYVDSDGTPGPSDNDLGFYTKFSYTKLPTTYKWRVPFDKNKANYSEGLLSDASDDKANYVYGEKEVWYLNTIETKNYKAIFYTSARNDGYGVSDRNGGMNTNVTLQKLDSIALFSKADLTTPIKVVHFLYDYSLCPGVPNNIISGSGKLTLKQIYFSYQYSYKGVLSPYIFCYRNTLGTTGSAVPYDLKSTDRWGNYKQNMKASPSWYNILSDVTLTNGEFPYVDQGPGESRTDAQTAADNNMSLWNLTSITLPSGGTINVTYESDDYQYVQNRPAMEMYKVMGTFIQNSSNTIPVPNASDYDESTMPLPRRIDDDNTYLVVKLDEPIPSTLTNPTDKINYFAKKYLSGINNFYFRFLYDIVPSLFGSPDMCDYVSGYVSAARINITSSNINGNTIEFSADGSCVALPFSSVSRDDVGVRCSPFTKAALQFARLNMSRIIYNVPGTTDVDSPSEQIFFDLLNSSMSKNIIQSIEGPNDAIYHNGYAQQMVPYKSWIRLNSSTGHKFGGGARVKQIQIQDDWSDMTTTSESQATYTQQYAYTLPDGSSSGVASYEPQVGGDENPFRLPIGFTEKALLAPNTELYLEEPFGECFFPAPTVGYSMVRVQNVLPSTVTSHSTGYTVNEFYTAKDFPTITRRTDLYTKHDKSFLNLSLILYLKHRDYMTTSQGYAIETNDMHGKPKSVTTYAHGQTANNFLSQTKYFYQTDAAGNLSNTCNVITQNGQLTQADLGVNYDAVADFRQSKTNIVGGSLEYNSDDFTIPPIIAFSFMIWPNISIQKTLFRSAVVTKVIQRFGTLNQVQVTKDGSTVTTNNLAYDAETGDLLLTQTQNDYDAPVYDFKFPAHWFYDGMGPAYQNIGYNSNLAIPGTDGVASVANAQTYYAQGDELEYQNTPDHYQRAWVLTVTPNTITIIDRDGNVLPSGSYNMTVTRSGRRNQQNVPMATIQTLSNPLPFIANNQYEKILQASAIEYGNVSRTFCDCFSPSYTTNPFVLGTMGSWRVKRTDAYLTDRTQNKQNGHSDIKSDGVFKSYTPFYNFNGSRWVTDAQNWTYATENTEFNPFNQEIESKDALGIYSAATFGYNQTQATAVAANTRYRELGYDGFEDYNFNSCADKHFSYNTANNGLTLSTDAHTGRYSGEVAHGTDAVMQRILSNQCDMPSDCAISYSSVTPTISSANNTAISLNNYTGAVDINWEVVYGNPAITQTVVSTTPTLQMTAGGNPSRVNITITDQKGCTLLLTADKPGTDASTTFSITTH